MKRDEWPLTILVIAVGVAYWNLLLPSPLQPYIAFDLGISLSKAAQLVTASAAAAVVTLLIYGLIGTKWTAKYVIMVGLAFLTVGSALALMTSNYTLLLGIRVFNGVADGCIYAASWVAIADYLKKERYGFGIRMLLVATALAGVIGLPLVNEWASSGNWQSAFKWFTVAGGIATVISVVGLWGAKEYPHEEEAIGGFRVILKDPHLNRLLVANVAVAVSWFGALTFLGGFITKTYLPTTFQVNVFYAAAGGAFVVGSFINWPNLGGQRWIALASGVLAIPLVIIFFAFTGGFWTTLLIACIFAVFRAPGIAVLETWLLEAAEQKAARVPAIVCVDLGPAIGTLVAASIGGIVLSQTAYVGIGSVFSAAAIVSLGFLIIAFRAHADTEKQTSAQRAKAEAL